jgi:L-threonylcarbamoyladenylate synthase
MSVRIIPITPHDPREERIEPAVSVLREGGVVVIPTETFYGLAADSADAASLERVNRLKGKPANSPILLLMSDVEQTESVAANPPPTYDLLASTFWPGPLTLVIPAAPGLSEVVTGGTGTVGVRVPGLTLPRRLAARLGRPISGVSANDHGEPPLRTAAEVLESFPEGIDLVLDGGTTMGGRPSTVVDLSRERPKVLRHGSLPASALRAFLPDLEE